MEDGFVSYFSPELVDEIIEKCTELIQSSPNEPRFYKDLGLAYMKKGSYTEAADAYHRCLDLKPRDTATLLLLGQAHLLLQDLETAEAAFKNALSQQSDWPDVHYWMGKVHFEAKRWTEAKQYLITAVEKNPRYQDAIYLLALIYEQEGDLRQAINELKRVIVMFPQKRGITPFPFDLEVLFEDPTLLDEIIRQLTQFLKNCDGFADLHFKLGMAFRRKGMKPEALAEFRKALRKNPNYHQARHYYWHWDDEPNDLK
jgi:tetratricopeptide (TPR) repeat protein